jgi:epoxyqueuosine reductase
MLDARLCLAHVLQADGAIPRSLRPAVGDRVYGCDECLAACPPGTQLLARSTDRRGRVDLFDLLASTDDDLLARHAHFFIPGRRPRYLRRNALVAVGNSGDRAALPVLAGYLGHPDWLLRLHAAWALGAVGGELAGRVLDAAGESETNDAVRVEIAAARADT